MDNLGVINSEQQHKLENARVSIIGNNIIGEIIAANLVGLGVQDIVLCGRRTSKRSPFNSALPSFFEKLNPYLNFYQDEKIYLQEHNINVSSIEEERDKGDIFVTVKENSGVISTIRTSKNENENLSIGGVVGALCADEFRKNLSQFGEFDNIAQKIRYSPKVLHENKPYKVLMIGAGGIGNYCAIGCAEKGMQLTVIDGDKYENRNKNRQIYCETGEFKSQRLCEIIKKQYNLVWDARTEFFKGEDYDVDLVIGCVDTIEARALISEWAEVKNIPYIDGGVSETKGQAKFKKNTDLVRKLVAESCAIKANPSIIIPNCIIGFHLSNMISFAIEEGKPYRFDYDTTLEQRTSEVFYEKC